MGSLHYESLSGSVRKSTVFFLHFQSYQLEHLDGVFVVVIKGYHFSNSRLRASWGISLNSLR